MPKQNPNQPIFYNNPVPLMLDRHADAALESGADYTYSMETNSVPTILPEFVEVAKVYPIVFAGNESADPVAVLGLENNKNLFVNSDGNWMKDKYIPAYIRRYPFAFLMQDDKLILCIDEDSNKFVKKAKKKDLKFFEGKEQSKTTKFALDYCLQFHRDQLVTQKFSQAVKDAGLLKIQQVTATFKEKENSRTLSGFKIVDEEKLKNLDSKTLEEWHKNGYLGMIYFHLLSLSNFSRLSNMMAK